jgi:hypothetical protein
MAHLSKTFFVNVDDDNTFVERTRRSGPQPGIVNNVIEVLHYPYGSSANRVQKRKYEG